MIVKVFPAKIKGEMLTDAYRCTEILTFGRFPNSGFSKHPHNFGNFRNTTIHMPCKATWQIGDKDRWWVFCRQVDVSGISY